MPTRKSDFKVIDTIGTGTFGVCKLITRIADGKKLVWKELDYGQMSEREKQMLVSEVNILRDLQHPNIVRYYDRVIDKENTKIYIVMEYCPGGDLASVIKKQRRDRCFMDEGYVWKIFGQILCALQDCHTRDGGAVLHRDLKPANVFLDKHGNVKLGDFGLARVLSRATSFARTFVGTPYYMSPEQLNERGYNEKSDIWSLGCLIYECAALTPPFNASNQAELTIKVNTGLFKKLPRNYSDDLNNIIKLMLQREPTRRPSINSILSNPIVTPHLPETTVVPAAGSQRARRRSSATPTPAGTTPTAKTPIATVAAAASPVDATASVRTRTPTGAHAVTADAEAGAGADTTHAPAAGAGLASREAELQAREDAVRLREQRVAEKEKELERREQEVLRKERHPSASRRRSESAVPQNPRLFRPMQPSNVGVGSYAMKYGNKV